jgi:hypothetical protein
MALQSSTLRPGLLVSLKTSVTGNVRYDKTIIEQDHTDANGAKIAKWETERRITDPAEHEAAQKARSNARHLIDKVCTKSAFGLLCPETDSEKLEAAIADARKITDDFNATAALTRVGVYVITGRIAPDDVEAVKAINSEVKDLLSAMQEGLANLDVSAVRAAANKAKQIGAMLTPDAAARIQIAVDLARKSAKEIVKKGEEIAQEVDKQTIKRIGEQRRAFLDFEDEKEVATPATQATAIDLPA